MDIRLLSFIFLFTLSNTFESFAQQKQPTIKLLNPSFEGPPKQGVEPSNWYNCGSPRETPPDIQPGFFNVSKPPQNGLSYLGMVVRDNDTRESVSQRLSSPLKVDYCYSFSIWLCHSETYLSKSPTTNQQANYVVPIKLRIYGGNNYCDKTELLAETGEITTASWLEYKFELKPKKDYNYILLEASHKTPTLIPYNGNILIDNASVLVPKYCGRQVAAVTNPRKPQDKPKTLPSTSTSTVTSTTTIPGNIPNSYDLTSMPIVLLSKKSVT
jgi:hypothetical protein